MFVTEVF